jgi:hypothetical protein
LIEEASTGGLDVSSRLSVHRISVDVETGISVRDTME